MALCVLTNNRFMKKNLAVWLAACLAGLVIGLAGSSFAAQTTTVTRTNLVDRWITNVVEIRMPNNVFVNEYRTNYLEQRRTNIVEVPQTKFVLVNAVRTNFVNSYRTNWGTLILTNDIRVEAFRTNFVLAYHTNWKALNLTNWQTVLIMKTNWITVPVTNMVTIDLITNQFTATEPRSTASENPEPKSVATSWTPLSGAVLSEELMLEASTTGKWVGANSHLEVQVKARWVNDPNSPPVVHQWRLERTDGAVLTFGQEQILKRSLPPGRYKVELRARRDSRSPLLAVRGTLAVTSRDALIERNVAQR